MAKDPAILAHQEWLGYVQPVGLVVSIPAMLDASVRVNQNFAPEHRNFLEALPTGSDGEPIPEVSDFPEFVESVLGWSRSDLYGAPGAPALPTSLEVSLPDYNETLRPTYALREFEPAENAPEWILLIKVLPKGADFDAVEEIDSRHWQASPQAKFERLLRQVHVPIGLLINGQQVRLVYAPDKELSGYITFKVSDMVKVAGRPIFGAFHMLLSAERLYSVAERERLPAILENSRKYQNVVSTQLANQVLEALYELLRGFQAADDQAQGHLLHDVLAADPDHVYRGLLTTLLRMVFVLYAEDRGLLSTDPVFANYYSITGLYEKLRIDDGRYPDTMDQRYGAWAQLLTLFRLVYRGGSHGAMRIPARDGYLFDPDRYLFLEGRRSPKDEVSIPQVPDGVLFRVLSKLLLLDGERISYRTLAVEQIGSVYEAIMGFELQVASGPSIAIKPAKKHGAPTTINLEALLQTASDKRLKWFTDETDQKLTGKAVDLLKAAATVNDLLNALERKIASSVTPGIVAKGAMIFQPSDERRRSGSHYTPSSLTGPIVEAALAPVLKQLGDNPTPTQILNLKVCDPAMGSGAFLVEACRQLGSELSRAWHSHDEAPDLPLDEDEALHAQRQIAQRCLYGVDKNPMATDLAKLSLWLATLAKDHPFTFLDHSLRAGDSLVGLTRSQIAAFDWRPSAQMSLLEQRIRKTVETVSNYRQQIFAARDDVPYALLKQKLDGAEDALSLPRQIGDAVIAAFFAGKKAKDRENIRTQLSDQLTSDLRGQGFVAVDGAIDKAIAKLKTGARSVQPFHWELEFPEIFAVNESGDQTGGFDVIVGNPPFAGKNTLSDGNREGYLDWLKTLHAESHGNADVVAHFFRRAFSLLREKGCLGLIATNTIAQGDTRTTGLRWICQNGGAIYRATKRLKWPGEASVVVSVVHISKSQFSGICILNNRVVDHITAYLFDSGTSDDPFMLTANQGKSYRGCEIGSLGFLITPEDEDFRAMSLVRDPRRPSTTLVKPFLRGLELNSSAVAKFVIDVDGLTESEMNSVPSIREYLRLRVRPDLLARHQVKESTREWWNFRRPSQGLRTAQRLSRILVIAQTSSAYGFTFVPPSSIFSHTTIGFISDSSNLFCILQSRVHQAWVLRQGSTMKDDPVYSPEDCFQTFPLPHSFENTDRLGESGERYYTYRSRVLAETQSGLTEIYGRFHDPHDIAPEIVELRQLHADMDHAVLDSYGWQDLKPVCDFFPEFDEEEGEDDAGRPRKKKYRYRWPDDVQDEVFARLLNLNRQSALEEGQLKAANESATVTKVRPKKRLTETNSSESGNRAPINGLFAVEEEEA